MSRPPTPDEIQRADVARGQEFMKSYAAALRRAQGLPAPQAVTPITDAERAPFQEQKCIHCQAPMARGWSWECADPTCIEGRKGAKTRPELKEGKGKR